MITWAAMWAAWAAALLALPLIAWILLGARRISLTHRRLTAGVLALGWACGVWGFLIEPETLVVRHVTIESPDWRGPPLRIGVISDLHVGAPHVTARRAESIVARMNAEHPDVVAILGDFAGGHRGVAERRPQDIAEFERGVGALARIEAPLGAWSVLGNHDWGYGRQTVIDALQAARVHTVDNRIETVARPAGAFRFGGIEGTPEQRFNPDAGVVADAPADGPPLIVLTHYPDPWPLTPRWTALTLAGHSHCGQVSLPLVGRLISSSRGAKRWPCGLYADGSRRLLVTGGVGVSILPVRFGAPPEIVIVTLRAARKPGRPRSPGGRPRA